MKPTMTQIRSKYRNRARKDLARQAHKDQIRRVSEFLVTRQVETGQTAQPEVMPGWFLENNDTILEVKTTKDRTTTGRSLVETIYHELPQELVAFRDRYALNLKRVCIS